MDLKLERVTVLEARRYRFGSVEVVVQFVLAVERLDINAAAPSGRRPSGERAGSVVKRFHRKAVVGVDVLVSDHILERTRYVIDTRVDLSRLRAAYDIDAATLFRSEVVGELGRFEGAIALDLHVELGDEQGVNETADFLPEGFSAAYHDKACHAGSDALVDSVHDSVERHAVAPRRVIRVARGALEVATRQPHKNGGNPAKGTLTLDCMENGVNGQGAVGTKLALLDWLDIQDGLREVARGCSEEQPLAGFGGGS